MSSPKSFEDLDEDANFLFDRYYNSDHIFFDFKSPKTSDFSTLLQAKYNLSSTKTRCSAECRIQSKNGSIFTRFYPTSQLHLGFDSRDSILLPNVRHSITGRFNCITAKICNVYFENAFSSKYLTSNFDVKIKEQLSQVSASAVLGSSMHYFGLKLSSGKTINSDIVIGTTSELLGATINLRAIDFGDVFVLTAIHRLLPGMTNGLSIYWHSKNSGGILSQKPLSFNICSEWAFRLHHTPTTTTTPTTATTTTVSNENEDNSIPFAIKFLYGNQKILPFSTAFIFSVTPGIRFALSVHMDMNKLFPGNQTVGFSIETEL